MNLFYARGSKKESTKYNLFINSVRDKKDKLFMGIHIKNDYLFIGEITTKILPVVVAAAIVFIIGA